MFTPLHSSANNHSSHCEKYDGAVRPSYHLKMKYPLSAMLDLLHSNMNQEVFEKYLCDKSRHYEKYG